MGVFDVFGNEIVFQISFPNCLLLTYKDIIDFCILALYPVTLVNLLVSSSGCFAEYLGFST